MVASLISVDRRKIIFSNPHSIIRANIKIHANYNNIDMIARLELLLQIVKISFFSWNREDTQQIFTCSKSTVETLEKGVKCFQSLQSRHQNDFSVNVCWIVLIS